MLKLDPRVKTIWSLGVFGRFFFLAAILLVADFMFLSDIDALDFAPKGAFSGAALLLGAILSIVWPILRYHYWAFDLRESELYVIRGVVTRVSTIAPFQRLQHIDVEQSFIDRIVGLGKLIVYTAGARGADIVIPGLPIEYAEELRDRLKNFSSEDAV